MLLSIVSAIQPFLSYATTILYSPAAEVEKYNYLSEEVMLHLYLFLIFFTFEVHCEYFQRMEICSFPR